MDEQNTLSEQPKGIKAKIKNRNSTPSRVLSLTGAHYGGVIISIIICFGLSGLMIKGTWGLLLSQLFALIAYSYPIYGTAWNMGHTDLNRANFGHIERKRFEGFKLGAIACAPLYLVSFLLILSKLGAFPNITVLYRLINAHTWPLLNIIHPNWEMANFSWGSVILFAVVPAAFAIALSGIGYLCGNYDFSPIQKLVYKDKKKDTKTSKKTSH